MLNSIFQCSHPSVWYLLDGIEKDSACHRQTLAASRIGQPVFKKKYENLDKWLAHAVRDYHEEQDKEIF